MLGFCSSLGLISSLSSLPGNPSHESFYIALQEERNRLTSFWDATLCVLERASYTSKKNVIPVLQNSIEKEAASPSLIRRSSSSRIRSSTNSSSLSVVGALVIFLV